MHPLQLPGKLTEKPSRRRFPDRLVAQHRRPVPGAAASSKPQVCGSNAFEKPVDVLLDDAALRQLRQELCQCNGAEFAWARLRQLLPRLRLRSTVKRGNCGCRPEFRRLVWYHSLCPRAPPIHATRLVPSPCVQWPRCLRFANCWAPALLPAQHPWPCTV